MILRRLATAIRKQDWFTVLIEMLVVVFGVYLGIQLGNWNAARGDRVEEREIVLRLLAEAEESERNIESVIERSSEFTKTAIRLHDRFFDTETLPDREVLAREMYGLGQFVDEGYIRASLDQIIASGRIRLIQSNDLLDAIADYREDALTSEKALENLGRLLLNAVEDQLLLFDARITPEGLSLVTPPEEILANETFRRRIGQMTMVYGAIDGTHQRTLQTNMTYKEALRTYADEKGWIE